MRRRGVAPGGDAPFDAAQIGLGGGEVLLAREQQRHVDRHAVEDRFLDRRNAFRRAGNLDEQIVASRLRDECRVAAAMLPCVSAASSGDTSIDTQPSTPSVASNTGRNRSAARRRSSSASSMNSASPDLPARDLVADAGVVGVAVADRFVEDRRIRGQAGDRELVDVAAQACRRRAASRVMLSSHRLWPRSCSCRVVFMLAPDLPRRRHGHAVCRRVAAIGADRRCARRSTIRRQGRLRSIVCAIGRVVALAHEHRRQLDRRACASSRPARAACRRPSRSARRDSAAASSSSICSLCT